MHQPLCIAVKEILGHIVHDGCKRKRRTNDSGSIALATLIRYFSRFLTTQHHADTHCWGTEVPSKLSYGPVKVWKEDFLSWFRSTICPKDKYVDQLCSKWPLCVDFSGHETEEVEVLQCGPCALQWCLWVSWMIPWRGCCVHGVTVEALHQFH